MYNPVVNPDNALDRRNVVLSRMLTNGVIAQEEYDAAKAEDLNLNVQRGKPARTVCTSISTSPAMCARSNS